MRDHSFLIDHQLIGASTMQFMCEKHRQQLMQSPEIVIPTWVRLINHARYYSDQRHWQNAIIAYGNALDTAEIIFSKKPVSSEVNRYVRTASELAYTIRKSDANNDLSILIESVTKVLEKELHPANISLLIRPLTDISNAPLKQVHCWMKSLFETDKYYPHQLH